MKAYKKGKLWAVAGFGEGREKEIAKEMIKQGYSGAKGGLIDQYQYKQRIERIKGLAPAGVAEQNKFTRGIDELKYAFKGPEGKKNASVYLQTGSIGQKSKIQAAYVSPGVAKDFTYGTDRFTAEEAQASLKGQPLQIVDIKRKPDTKIDEVVKSTYYGAKIIGTVIKETREKIKETKAYQKGTSITGAAVNAPIIGYSIAEFGGAVKTGAGIIFPAAAKGFDMIASKSDTFSGGTVGWNLAKSISKSGGDTAKEKLTKTDEYISGYGGSVVADMQNEFNRKYSTKIAQGEITQEQALERYQKSSSYKSFQKKYTKQVGRDIPVKTFLKRTGYAIGSTFDETTPSKIAVYGGTAAATVIGGYGMLSTAAKGSKAIAFVLKAVDYGFGIKAASLVPTVLYKDAQTSERVGAAVFIGVYTAAKVAQLPKAYKNYKIKKILSMPKAYSGKIEVIYGGKKTAQFKSKKLKAFFPGLDKPTQGKVFAGKIKKFTSTSPRAITKITSAKDKSFRLFSMASDTQNKGVFFKKVLGRNYRVLYESSGKDVTYKIYKKGFKGNYKLWQTQTGATEKMLGFTERYLDKNTRVTSVGTNKNLVKKRFITQKKEYSQDLLNIGKEKLIVDGQLTTRSTSVRRTILTPAKQQSVIRAKSFKTGKTIKLELDKTKAGKFAKTNPVDVYDLKKVKITDQFQMVVESKTKTPRFYDRIVEKSAGYGEFNIKERATGIRKFMQIPKSKKAQQIMSNQLRALKDYGQKLVPVLPTQVKIPRNYIGSQVATKDIQILLPSIKTKAQTSLSYLASLTNVSALKLKINAPTKTFIDTKEIIKAKTLPTQAQSLILNTAVTTTPLTSPGLTEAVITTPEVPIVPIITTDVPIITTTSAKPVVPTTKATQKMGQAYNLFVKRQGAYRKIGGPLGRGEAIKKGTKITKATAAATFKIQQAKGQKAKVFNEQYVPSRDEFRDYEIKKGRKKKLKDEWIQRRSKRLGRKSEVVELISKRKSKGRFKFL